MSIVNSRTIDRHDITRGELIASGRFADVYKGTWAYSDKPVAIKVWCMKSLLEHVKTEYDDAGAFLTNPHLLTVFGVCVYPGKYADVMELMDTSLHQLYKDPAKANDKLTLRNIGIIGSGIANGVAYLHSKGIAHKYLKSQNVLLSEDLKTVKICDQGRSKLRLEMGNCAQGREDATVRYRSPETFTREYAKQKDNIETTKQTDSFALGMLLWTLFARHEPYQADTEAIALGKVQTNQQETIPENCTRAHAHLIQNCWKPSGQRPSALEFKSELKKADDFVQGFVDKINLASNCLFADGQMKDIYEQSLKPFLSQVMVPEALHQPAVKTQTGS
ncbi:MAG: protein kinase [Verrucomicrobia bacterium]|nr:protein kinase [Verrucomicrobiota bacterium]